MQSPTIYDIGASVQSACTSPPVVHQQTQRFEPPTPTTKKDMCDIHTVVPTTAHQSSCCSSTHPSSDSPNEITKHNSTTRLDLYGHSNLLLDAQDTSTPSPPGEAFCGSAEVDFQEKKVHMVNGVLPQKLTTVEVKHTPLPLPLPPSLWTEARLEKALGPYGIVSEHCFWPELTEEDLTPVARALSRNLSNNTVSVKDVFSTTSESGEVQELTLEHINQLFRASNRQLKEAIKRKRDREQMDYPNGKRPKFDLQQPIGWGG
eukprot:TRINITY_DN87153_c0_g1_i1.p1 TRINITY_DN87153_c0_g1~~TRINITY_DN87153_c0_g1_i1.p1  ORF type:complete len:261 (+),score=18.27 TRINITY_DN87153_c0_g1_i1:89-871(+)